MFQNSSTGADETAVDVVDVVSDQDDGKKGALYGGWLTRYQHIERLGHEEVEGLLVGDVVMQTKIDGANLTVATDPEKGLIIASRNQAISIGGWPSTGFQGAVEHIQAHEGIRAFRAQHPDLILRGEWLVRHTVLYFPEAYKQFYVFDVQDANTGEYIRPSVYMPTLGKYGIKYIPVLGEATDPTVEDLVKYTEGPDEFGAKQKEGIVIKNYGFRNRWGRTQWGKLVSADFTEKRKLALGASKHDPDEIRFVAGYVTEELVQKTIEKVRMEHEGTVSVQNMGEVLGRVYHDAFFEELWDFAKKGTVTINFRTLRRLTERKARDVALAHFNGIPMGYQKERPADVGTEPEVIAAQA